MEEEEDMAHRNTDMLYYLSVLAEEQNITRAAERLYISQPALTAFLNRLESELSVRLFDRSVIPIRLTEAGRYYISEMRRIEDLKNQLTDDMRSLEQDSRQTLRIGIGRNRGALWLPRALELLHTELPGIRVRLFEDRDVNMAEHVARGMLHVAILETFAYIGDLPYTQVADERHCFVTGYDNPAFAGFDRSGNTPDHPLDVDASLLNRQTFLCPGVRSSLNDYTRWLFANYRLNPRDIMLVANSFTSYELALKNFGCAFLCTRYAALARIAEKPLFIMPGGQPVYRRLYAVYPRENPPLEVEAFVHGLTQSMQEDLSCSGVQSAGQKA